MEILDEAHSLWKKHLQAFDLALDLTCGNGHDTYFLATCLPNGDVFGVDLQIEAIQNTKERTKNFSNVTLFQLSHPELPPLPRKPRLVVYNLGYLPNGDKSITTKVETTLASVSKILDHLEEDGAISITCYPGHLEGEKEEKELLQFASSLCKKNWIAKHYRLLNREKAPSLIWIEKKKFLRRPKSSQSECGA